MIQMIHNHLRSKMSIKNIYDYSEKDKNNLTMDLLSMNTLVGKFKGR